MQPARLSAARNGGQLGIERREWSPPTHPLLPPTDGQTDRQTLWTHGRRAPCRGHSECSLRARALSERRSRPLPPRATASDAPRPEGDGLASSCDRRQALPRSPAGLAGGRMLTLTEGSRGRGPRVGHRDPEREGERIGGAGGQSFCAADSKLSKLMVFVWFCWEGEEADLAGCECEGGERGLGRSRSPARLKSFHHSLGRSVGRSLAHSRLGQRASHLFLPPSHNTASSVDPRGSCCQVGCRLSTRAMGDSRRSDISTCHKREAAAAAAESERPLAALQLQEGSC